jgi:hypothetical protein
MPLLRVSDKIVVSSDSVILDGAVRWVNAASHLISQQIPQAWLADFRSAGD